MLNGPLKNGTTQLNCGKLPVPIYTTNSMALYGLDKTGGGANLAVGALYINYNNAEETDVVGDFKISRRVATGATAITPKHNCGTGYSRNLRI